MLEGLSTMEKIKEQYTGDWNTGLGARFQYMLFKVPH